MPLRFFAMLLPPLAMNVLALGAGLRRRERLDRPAKGLLVYLLLCLVNTLAMTALAWSRGNNWVLVHLFAPLQLAIFAWIYSAWTAPWLGRLLQALALVYALACLWLLPREDLSRISGFSFQAQTLLLMGFSLALLCQLALQIEVPLLEHPGAWIASGVLCDTAFTLVAYPSRTWLQLHAPSWVIVLSLARVLVVTLSYLFFLRALRLASAVRAPRS